MDDAPAERPRAWWPVAAAAAIAVVVIVAAIATYALTSGPTEIEAEAIEACEAAHAAAGGPAIAAGDVYDPTELRDYYAVAETHGDVPVPLDDLPQATLDAWDATGERWQASGDGAMVVVWRLEDDSYAQCVVPVSDGSVAAGAAVPGPLAVTSQG